MTARRYVVRRLDGYRRGDRRWVVWDTQQRGWADDAHTTRRSAQEVCDELNTGTCAPAQAPPSTLDAHHPGPSTT